MTDTAPAPQLDAETVAWLQRADAALARWQQNPNDLLAQLLRAECIVQFRTHVDGELVQAEIFTPDNQWVTGTGQNAAHALLLTYLDERAASAHAALQAAAIVATAPAGVTDPAAQAPALSLVK